MLLGCRSLTLTSGSLLLLWRPGLKELCPMFCHLPLTLPFALRFLLPHFRCDMHRDASALSIGDFCIGPRRHPSGFLFYWWCRCDHSGLLCSAAGADLPIPVEVLAKVPHERPKRFRFMFFALHISRLQVLCHSFTRSTCVTIAVSISRSSRTSISIPTGVFFRSWC